MKHLRNYIFLSLLYLLLAFISFKIFERMPGVPAWNPSEAALFNQSQIKFGKYQETACPSNSIQIAYFGQSNTVNSVIDRRDLKFPTNLYQFDFKSGKCFEYKEPLLGTSGTGGNAITPFAIHFATVYRKNIIIIPFGVGASSVLEWSYGYLSHLHHHVMLKIQDAGLTPDVFLWTQGEADSHPNWFNDDRQLEIKFSQWPYFETYKQGEFVFGISAELYETSLTKIIAQTRSFFPKTYFGIALASKFIGLGQNGEIRKAQQELAERLENVFLSADSDLIWENSMRDQQGHLSFYGANILGEQYFSSVSKIIPP